MIARITGTLESVEGLAALVKPGGAGSGLVYEVLVPAYLAARLAGQVGQAVTLQTMDYLEGQGQGSSFIPRLIGFTSVRDRKFFELFTTVKGVGNRKALKALAAEPGLIARAIASRDTKALFELPEIGRRLAETIVAELNGKVEPFLAQSELEALEFKAGARVGGRMGGATEEAVDTLVTLGHTRGDAERLVRAAVSRNGKLETTEEIVAAAFGGQEG
jgi:Holliday junction DNA helicase RuvA